MLGFVLKLEAGFDDNFQKIAFNETGTAVNLLEKKHEAPFPPGSIVQVRLNKEYFTGKVI